MASEPNKPRQALIPAHGGYRELKSYQNAEIVFDATIVSAIDYKPYVESDTPEGAANTLICLINQTNYLLDQQLRRLDRQFLEEGSFTEKLYQARIQARRDRALGFSTPRRGKAKI